MAEPRMEPIGRVERFFAQPSVAVVELTAPLRAGEVIYIKGHTTDFQQTVQSMQVNHVSVTEASPGDSVGLLVKARCRKHDLLYRLTSG